MSRVHWRTLCFPLQAGTMRRASQDTLLGCRQITMRDCFITKDVFMNIMMWLEKRVSDVSATVVLLLSVYEALFFVRTKLSLAHCFSRLPPRQNMVAGVRGSRTAKLRLLLRGRRVLRVAVRGLRGAQLLPRRSWSV